MALSSAVESAVEAKVVALGYDFYELKYFSAGGKKILRVFVDRAEGISLDDCAAVSHALSDMLDELPISESAYTLEVSSPGLDRLLVTPRDFRRILNKKVQVRFTDELEKQCKTEGLLTEVTEEHIQITLGKKVEVIPFTSIISGKFTI